MFEKFSHTSHKKLNFFILALLGVIVFTLYSSSLGHNFLFDEEHLILKNPYIHDIRHVAGHFKRPWFYFPNDTIDWRQYYRPLAAVTLSLDYWVWRLNPLGYNLTNLFWHILVCLSLYFLLSRVLASRLLAFILSVLYAAHPAHTQAVTYVASRGDLMAAFFVLSAILLYDRQKFTLAGLMIPLGMLCKENAVLIPVYLFVWDIYKNKKITLSSSWQRWVYFLALSSVVPLIKHFYAHVPSPPSPPALEGFLRVFSMGPALANYASAFIWPEYFKHSLYANFAGSYAQAQVLATLVLYVAILAIWLYSWREKGRLFLTLSFIGVAMLPYLQYIHFQAEWSEHYLYVAMIGVFMGIGSAVELALKRARYWMWVFVVLGIFFGSFWSVRTLGRNHIFNDTDKYYDTLSQSDSPYAFIGYQYKSQLALNAEDYGQCLALAKMGDAVYPNDENNYYLMATAYLMMNKHAQALTWYQRAYEASGGNTYYLLGQGNTYLMMGRYAQAEAMFRQMLEARPDLVSAYIGLSSCYELAYDAYEAVDLLKEAIVRLPDPSSKFRVSLLRIAAAFRSQDRELYRQAVKDYAVLGPQGLWYGDILNLLNGKTDPRQFLEAMLREAKGFDSAAARYALMRCWYSGQMELFDQIYLENIKILVKNAKTNPLVKKELRLYRLLLKNKI